jgi:hypothetical protein
MFSLQCEIEEKSGQVRISNLQMDSELNEKGSEKSCERELLTELEFEDNESIKRKRKSYLTVFSCCIA